jgi:hypothetical protein
LSPVSSLSFQYQPLSNSNEFQADSELFDGTQLYNSINSETLTANTANNNTSN